MNTLRQVSKQDLLGELKNRIKMSEITEKEVISLIRYHLHKEEEEWKKAYSESAQDQEREKEAESWENLED